MILGSPNSKTQTHFQPIRGHNSLTQFNPLAERFHKEQLKRKFEYDDRGMDRYQREVFVSLDKAAEEEKVEERRRTRELKNQINLENRRLEENRQRALHSSKMRDQLEEQDRILKGHKELEEERRRTISNKLFMRDTQSKALQVQTSYSPDLTKHLFPGLNSRPFAKLNTEPQREMKKQMIESIRTELDRQIESKRSLLEREKREIIEERRRASLVDLMEKNRDIEMKAKKNKDQVQMRLDLDQQIRNKYAMATPRKLNNAKSLNIFGKSTNLPDHFIAKGSKGRGFFSPYNLPPKSLW